MPPTHGQSTVYPSPVEPMTELISSLPRLEWLDVGGTNLLGYRDCDMYKLVITTTSNTVAVLKQKYFLGDLPQCCVIGVKMNAYGRLMDPRKIESLSFVEKVIIAPAILQRRHGFSCKINEYYS